MSDIYGYDRDGTPAAVFSSQDAALTIEGSVESLMIQDWQVGYAQDVQEIFELGSDNIYWVRGRPQGQGAINRIVGPRGFEKILGSAAYDVCEGGGAAMSIGAQAGTCDGSSTDAVSLNMSGVLVTNVGFSSSVSSQAMIQNGITFKFSKMSDPS